MRPRLANPPVGVAATRAAIVVALLVALAGAVVLAIVLGRWTAATGGASSAYSQQVYALGKRHDASISQLEQLLSARDANPTLVESPEWLRAVDKVNGELTAEYSEVRALSPSTSDLSSQTCLENAYRLSAEGASLLVQGFRTGGHGAYYFASHGNWDLNLGTQQLGKCHAQK